MAKVQSLGEHADPTALVGEVKLEEGANIQIERDDEHNSLIITDTRGTFPDFRVSVAVNVGQALQAPLDNPDLGLSVA